MNFQICTGMQEKAGVTRERDVILFSTRAPEHADCKLFLYPRDNGTVLKIPMKAQESGKTLYTVGIHGLDWENYDYNFEINGREVIDKYARKITGREIWGDEKRRPKLLRAGEFVPQREQITQEDGGKEPGSLHHISKAEKSNIKIKGSFYFSDFNWKKDKNPEIAKEDMVMYKLHVRSFSMGMRKSNKKRGTVGAIYRRLDALKNMGITTVLFMPLYEFEEFLILDESKSQENPQNLLNCWGYTAGSYFAPKASFLSENNPDELKRLIMKMHEKGMECILEFYFSEKLNLFFIIDILHYWHREYHVDGFRIIGNPTAAKLLARDETLSGCKLFFDGFSEEQARDPERFGPKLYTYNEEFLYGMRKILNHHNGSIYEFACQMRRQQSHQGFVNYIAENNGFTLWDVFSYEQKHNELNGEDNRDGNYCNYSSNCGQEGFSRKYEVLQLRKQQVRNALAILFFAQGVPLLWMGDECCNSQNGNNNAYCQDNEIGWKEWRNNELCREMIHYVSALAGIRKKYRMIRMPDPYKLIDYKNAGSPDLSYHSDAGWKIDFNMNRGFIGMFYCGVYAETTEHVYIAYNFQYYSQKFALPGGIEWKLLLDTAREEAVLAEAECLGEIREIEVEGQAICFLTGSPAPAKKRRAKINRRKE
ncbi:glycogen operon protein GlgX [Lachnospiraceae bacterium 45-W7]